MIKGKTSLFKTAHVRDSKDKPSVDWDGKGKHPILNMTAEEIKAFNEGVADRHAGTHADTEEKAPQPSFEQEVGNQTARSLENQQKFVEVLASNLSTRKS